MRLHAVFQPDSADNLAGHGLLAEELGFEGAWVANMLSARDPFLSLAVLARKSRRLRLGPAAVSPFELHPVKIAGSLLTLNEFARGRAHIAIGGGGGTTIGMGFKPQRTSNMPRMVRGVRECVELLRLAGSGRPFDYAGELFEVRGLAPAWAGATAPLIYVAANKPQMLRLAGEIADGVMLSDIDLPFLDATLAELGRGLARGGRSRDSLRVNNLIAWHVKPDREAAYAEARRQLWVRGIWERARLEPYLTRAECDLVQRSLPAWQAAYAAGSDTIPGVPRAVVDRLVDDMTLTGGPGDLGRLCEKLLKFRQAGIDEIALRLYAEPADSIRLIAGRVAPALA
jgi:5,10-methylenetetrahydromethanopterin reductase